MKQFSAFVTLGLLSSVAWVSGSCAIPVIHSTFTEAPPIDDLTGVWTASYKGEYIFGTANNLTDRPGGIERFSLYADGTYEQFFKDGEGYEYHGPRKPWRVSLESNGSVFLWFEGMRYYPGGIRYAEANETGEDILELEGSQSDPSSFLLCFQDEDLNLCFKRQRAGS